MTQPQDKMRAEFEAWAKICDKSINLTHEGAGYRYSLAEMYWESWQAACAQQSTQSQQDALDASLWRFIEKIPGAWAAIGESANLPAEDAGCKSFRQSVAAAIAAQGASNV